MTTQGTIASPPLKKHDQIPGKKLRITAAVSVLAVLVINVLPAAARSAIPSGANRSILSNVQAAAFTLTSTAVADAYAAELHPTTNYGTANNLQVSNASGRRLESYIRFSVSGITGTVQSAQVRVFMNTANASNGPAIYATDNSWTETSITWNNRAALTTGILDNKGAITKGTWVPYTVTSQVTGNGTYSFVLVGDSNDKIGFSSREGSNPPQLVIVYNTTSTTTSTGIAPTATRTPTGVPSATPTVTSVAPTVTRTPTGVPSVTPTATTTVGPSPTAIPGSIKHVFVVVMENHSYNEVWNTSSSPYITSLGNSYARATNYHALTHPSLPNYLDLYGGSNYSITDDCSPSSSCHVNATNLGDNMDAKGLTWKGYLETMPAPCTLSDSGDYAVHHNPMAYFDDIYLNTTRCEAHDVPYTTLAADLASASTTPNYALITPNLCSDMHDCSVSTGDTWLKNNLPAILNSPACTVDKCLLILTWDEDDGSQNNQVLTIFAGTGAKTGGVTSAVSYTHFSLLRTVENIFGLPTQTSNDTAASPMTDLLK